MCLSCNDQGPFHHKSSRRSAQAMLFPMRPAYEGAGPQKASSQKFSGLNVSQQCMPADGAGRCSEAPGSQGPACCSAGVMGSSAVTGTAAAASGTMLYGGGPSGRCQPVRSSTSASDTPGGSTQTHMLVGAVLRVTGRSGQHAAASMPWLETSHGLVPHTVQTTHAEMCQLNSSRTCTLPMSAADTTLVLNRCHTGCCRSYAGCLQTHLPPRLLGPCSCC